MIAPVVRYDIGWSFVKMKKKTLSPFAYPLIFELPTTHSLKPQVYYRIPVSFKYARGPIAVMTQPGAWGQELGIVDVVVLSRTKPEREKI